MAFNFQVLRTPTGRQADSGGSGSLFPRWVDWLPAGFKPATEGAWLWKGGAARVGGAGAGLREAKPGARKTGALGASVCLFKCQGLCSRPAARSRIYNPFPPAPALVARPVRAGAADRGKPSYLLLLFSSCSTFREICVRGCTAASVNRHCPHHLHFLGCYAAVRSGKGRNASFPAA